MKQEPKKCPKHNLPETIICTGEMCNKRIGCHLCIDKHDHKFYLDTKFKQKDLSTVQTQIMDKISHLQKYTKSNLDNLRLQNYRSKIENTLHDELLYMKNKIEEEMMSINLWIEKIQNKFTESIQASLDTMMKNWKKYNGSAMKFMANIDEYEEILEYFKKGDWSAHEHVDRSVGFLYSEELFFRFNRNLDALKQVINHHKKEDKSVFDWFQERREEFVKFEICPHKTFEKILNNFDRKPEVTDFVQPKTKEQKDDRASILDLIKEDSKTVLLYPQQIYEPFQNIYKLIRYDNQIFATSGSRAVNIWTRVSITPEKSYELDFPSYGLLSFVEYGKDDPEQIVYGKSNGEMGLINISKEEQKEMPAHEAAIRDIIQVDSYHFLTASQDWKMKLWAMSSEKDKYFASERLTLSGHSGRVLCLCKFGPNVLAGGSDGTIKLWDIMRESFDEVFLQEKEIYCIAEMREQLFATGGEIKEIRIWDYRKTKTYMTKFPIEGTCNSILRYDENILVFNDRNVVKVVDFRYPKEPVMRMENQKTYSHTINSMTYLSDSEIGMGGSDNIVSIWKY